MAELCDKSVDHSWLWVINPRDGARLSATDFVIAVQSRLGATFTGESVSCRQCGEVVDPKCSHASCCARAESTKGHYAVVRSVVDGMSVVDPCIQTEVRNLVNTTDRPADILTWAALPGKLTAIDVTIASQDAVQAGPDCCAAAYRRKVRRYASILPALHRAGITFMPMVFSNEGRQHPATTRMLQNMANAMSRKFEDTEVKLIKRRWLHDIGVAIQRRKAAMIRACLPDRSHHEHWLLQGVLSNAEASDTPGARASQLEPLEEVTEESRWVDCVFVEDEPMAKPVLAEDEGDEKDEEAEKDEPMDMG